tara:strand:+ start:620 stop:1252 length:633 start_codon:yes stop_codon:yes gene_type:complete
MKKSKFVEYTFGISAILVLILGMGDAFAETYKFTNTLPNYLEIEQNDVIFLKNLSNSTINLRHTDGLFSSGELYTNGTWTGNMPYDPGVYEWINTNSTGTIVIKEKQLMQQEVIVEDNIIQGKVEPEKTVAVTIVSPSNEVTNKIVKSDSNGSFETKLNPEEKGKHEIYITQDSHTLRTTYTVEDEFKNLELRLDILKALRDILEIIFGK